MRKIITDEKEQIRQDEIRARNAKLETIKRVVSHLPRGVTLHDLKVMFIEHILECNSYVKTSAARELGVNYKALVAFLSGEGLAPVIPPEKRRGRPFKAIPLEQEV